MSHVTVACPASKEKNLQTHFIRLLDFLHSRHPEGAPTPAMPEHSLLNLVLAQSHSHVHLQLHVLTASFPFLLYPGGFSPALSPTCSRIICGPRCTQGGLCAFSSEVLRLYHCRRQGVLATCCHPFNQKVAGISCGSLPAITHPVLQLCWKGHILNLYSGLLHPLLALLISLGTRAFAYVAPDQQYTYISGCSWGKICLDKTCLGHRHGDDGDGHPWRHSAG